MRIAISQINPTVGDLRGNTKLILRDISRAKDRNAQIIIFPELALIGYPPKDLLLKPRVIKQCADLVEHIAQSCTGITAFIGYPIASPKGAGHLLQNAVAVCADGQIQNHHVKTLLPNYDVFDERRYFEPADTPTLTTIDNQNLGISICEDLWNEHDVFERPLYHLNPVDQLVDFGADILINAAASPYVLGKHEFRLNLMRHVARKHHKPIVYCNQVGGNDELVFDGNSCVINASGEIIAHAKDFEEDLLIADLPDKNSENDRLEGRIEQPKTGLNSVYHALTLGLRDYVRKCGFTKIVLGLSGGIDSALTCAIAVDAIGKENVIGIGMPSRYSSDGSVSDAEILASNLGIDFHVIPIEQAHTALESMLTDLFKDTQQGVTEENIQARIRGNVMMSISNKFGALLVTTGNKSEMAVGYCTLYGDMCGGFSVLCDVPKTMVYDLSRWINDSPDSPLLKQYNLPVIPVDTITKPPSAELRPDQKDQDSLPDYEILDEIVERYVEKEQSAAHIIDETDFDKDIVLRMVRLIDLNEYKRRQAAPGLKITGRAFGFGRRMPIAQRYDNRWSVGD
ncbi:Glutamine-dependent NAD(+) synthetase [Poriferisphaera corsica]|uniref:Glutamine-dependent NAD(+) synthetase n=1 Tax=Poriferisphaera corsica TaxID=2528020 RepID=A0A517YWJ2_9BACT|nr:NAD+ synthase [Poriferisphaera corsica]QDU34598.1 Glutamine-dependent NAD(+) synthetase [Poriferisphaera corsica]